jgi:hypothetical protein
MTMTQGTANILGSRSFPIVKTTHQRVLHVSEYGIPVRSSHTSVRPASGRDQAPDRMLVPIGFVKHC